MSRKITSVLLGVFIFIVSIQIFSCFTNSVYTETEIAFTPDNKFDIPSNNSSISFSTNGTYQMASLENGTWNFDNLIFVNSQEQEELNLEVSAINCDIKINFFRIYNRTFDGENAKRATLRYTILGTGIQFFNLGLDPKAGALDARLNGEWVGKNHGWTHSSDGTFTITGASENVTLLYYGYPDSISDNENVFVNHSIVVASTFSVSIVIFLAIFFAQRKELK